MTTRKRHFGSLVDIEDLEYFPELNPVKDFVMPLEDLEDELESIEDLEYIEDLEDIDEDEDEYEVPDLEELGIEDFDLPPAPDEEQIKKEKGQYVNEHMLSILMSMFRNWDSQAHPSIIFQDNFKEARAAYETFKATYIQAQEEGFDKRSQRIQVPFMQMLEISGKVYPTNKEIEELYSMISLISNRCVGLYARNKGIESDDIVSTSFERWIKYRHNFDPLKRSKISGTRVNAFAYMTQLIKNTIFEASNKIKKQRMLEERLRNDMTLNESLTTATITVSKPLSDEDGSASNVQTFSTLDDQASNLDSDIIRCLMQKAHNFTSLKYLILEVEKEGFTKDEIFKVIDSYGLLEGLQEVICKNVWAF